MGKLILPGLGRPVIFALKKNEGLKHVLAVLNKMDIVITKETKDYFIIKSDSLCFKKQ